MNGIKTYISVALLLGFSLKSQAQDRQIRTLEELEKGKVVKASEDRLTEDFMVKSYPLRLKAIPEVRIKSYDEHELESSDLPTDVQYEEEYIPKVRVAVAAKVPTAYISCNTVRKSAGKFYKLDKIEYEVRETAPDVSNKTTGNRSYAAHSVLQTGEWYKIAVMHDDIYALDYNFLSSQLGLNLAGINSNRIQIFGNGGKMKDWDNNVIPVDDLKEVPVKLLDGGDGRMDAGDRIVFFASGPDTRDWDFQNSQFSHRKNKYEDRSYYFIRIDGGVSEKIKNSNISNAGRNSDVVYQHIYREKDSTIIDLVGGYWLGDAIGGSNTQKNWSFKTHSPIADSNISIAVTLDYQSTTNAGNLQLTADGTPIYQGNFSPQGVDYFYAVVDTRDLNLELSSRSNINLGLQLNSGSFSDRGYLKSVDITVPSRVNLDMGTPFIFSDHIAASSSLNTKYSLTGAVANTEIWNVADIHETTMLPIQGTGSTAYFVAPADSQSLMVAVRPQTDGNIPEYHGRIENQDLHSHQPVDLVIVTHEDFASQAEDLADYRSQRGLSSRVVRLKELYNEFSSGSQDPVAIRDYMKMLYDKAGSAADAPKNLLLMGSASYDYKGRIETSGNTNFVPTIETEHIVRINSFNTDDFFGFLDDDENPLALVPAALDIGIGRIPCKSGEQASRVVAKIKHYESPQSFGNWKLKNVYLADNADPAGSAHMLDAEQISDSVFAVNDIPNTLKAYGDAFTLVSSGGGSRLPDFNSQINQYVNQGALIVNYNGHGGYKGLGQEGFLTLNDINSWRNPDNLPIFITATCDFSKFDFPKLESAGEKVLINNNSGGIALITTTQAVYRSANRVMNTDYLVDQFATRSGRLATLGEAWMKAKNEYFNGSPNIGTTYNYQKFCLLGDPAMSPAFPEYRVVIDSITRIADGRRTDTLKARGSYEMHGHLTDANGNLLSDFAGNVLPSIYDKPKQYSTVYQYPSIPIRNFNSRNSIIYKGNGKVSSGRFTTKFILPKDIQYQYGPAKISSYAESDQSDAAGADYTYIIGGEDTSVAEDKDPPILRAFLDDENFVNGSITTKDPVLLLNLEDISGINTSGSSIGHDLIAVLDDDASKTYVLNDHYTASPDDYTKGTVKYPLYDIEPGLHHLNIKVWDGANNSASARLDFEVINQEELELRHVFNYPNPFSTKTNFMFEHNFPNELLKIKLNIYSVSGKLIQSINRQTVATGTRIDDIEWNGRDNRGDPIGNGAYYYTLEVLTESGKSAKKIEKLYIIK